MYDNGKLYVETGKGLVGCYDAKTGAKRWTRHLKEWGGRPHGWGHSESVLILGKLAIVTPGGTSCMVALNKETGETVWESGKFAQSNYSSPLYVVHDGVPMIVNGTHGGILGVHAKTGKILWTNSFCKGNTANCPTPVYADGYVFWSNGYGRGGICLKLTKSGDGVTAKEVWRTKDMVCHHGGFIVLDGHIYGNHGGGWSCLELKTGRKVWHGKGVGKGSLCYADGMLYLFGERGGKMGLAKAVTSGLEMCGEFSVKGSGPSWAHPSVADGRLYLRYAENLYCFDVKAK
jgi:outer membrane protein assembly factor BamB